jgi:hypothetical protein
MMAWEIASLQGSQTFSNCVIPLKQHARVVHSRWTQRTFGTSGSQLIAPFFISGSREEMQFISSELLTPNATAQRRGQTHRKPLTEPKSHNAPLFPRPLQWVVRQHSYDHPV